MRYKLSYVEGYRNGYIYCGFSLLSLFVSYWTFEVCCDLKYKDWFRRMEVLNEWF